MSKMLWKIHDPSFVSPLFAFATLKYWETHTHTVSNSQPISTSKTSTFHEFACVWLFVTNVNLVCCSSIFRCFNLCKIDAVPFSLAHTRIYKWVGFCFCILLSCWCMYECNHQSHFLPSDGIHVAYGSICGLHIIHYVLLLILVLMKEEMAPKKQIENIYGGVCEMREWTSFRVKLQITKQCFH